MKYYHGEIKGIKKNQIFVFGSNPEGRHGAGTALLAKKFYGAVYGVGRGLQGNSYALPTKNLKSNYLEKETGILYKVEGPKSITFEQIVSNIKDLYELSLKNKDKEFLIAYQNKGYNLNGYTSEEMLDMFIEAGKPFNGIPENITLSITYKELYEKKMKNIENTESISLS